MTFRNPVRTVGVTGTVTTATASATSTAAVVRRAASYGGPYGYGNASAVVTIPSGAQVGDLLVLVTSCNGTPATPAGWTRRDVESAQATLSLSQVVFSKVCAAGDAGSTVTVANPQGTSGAALQAAIVVYANATTVTAGAASADITTSQGSTAVSLNTTAKAVYLLALFSVAHQNNSGPGYWYWGAQAPSPTPSIDALATLKSTAGSGASMQVSDFTASDTGGPYTLTVKAQSDSASSNTRGKIYNIT